MELLTHRLSALMNQVAENQIAELVDKDRLQQQRLMEKEQRSKMLSYKTSDQFFQARQHRNNMSIRNVLAKKKEDDSKNSERDTAEKIRKVATLSSIWGAKKAIEKPISKGPATPSAANKFQKVARFAALISSVKQGRDLCTCESLDAQCKIHDS